MPSRVLDLGCGLGPLALPWMGLAPDTIYIASDVDRRPLATVAEFLELVGQPHRIDVRDLVADPPADTPTSRSSSSSSPRSTARIRGPPRACCAASASTTPSSASRHARWAAAARGWSERYRDRLERLAADAGRVRAVAEASVPNELVFVLTLDPRMAEPLVTRRGTLAVPTFLPDATRAGVRGVSSDDLRRIGIDGRRRQRLPPPAPPGRAGGPGGRRHPSLHGLGSARS